MVNFQLINSLFIFNLIIISNFKDEIWLKNLISKTVYNNFCVSKEYSFTKTNTNESLQTNNLQPLVQNIFTTQESEISMYNDNTNTNLMMQNDVPNKQIKKAVTFMSGLITSERSATSYNGALLSGERFNLSEETFANLIFSKFIVKQVLTNESSKKDKTSLKAYTENSLNDLMMSATEDLQKYEYIKSLRINFVFHDEAIRHLARLTRIFVS